ncbi:hypothetical protein BDZ89DRAFT_1177261 [Hymenopellis radicata]|nr:hypothetical protein BDZ89DRAFT_1177261 [Hymenopellis radicata]
MVVQLDVSDSAYAFLSIHHDDPAHQNIVFVVSAVEDRGTYVSCQSLHTTDEDYALWGLSVCRTRRVGEGTYLKRKVPITLVRNFSTTSVIFNAGLQPVDIVEGFGGLPVMNRLKMKNTWEPTMVLEEELNAVWSPFFNEFRQAFQTLQHMHRENLVRGKMVKPD